MRIVEGWIFRIHCRGAAGNMLIFLKGPPADEKQGWGEFLEIERFFPTRAEAKQAMNSFRKGPDVVQRDVQHVRMQIADHPNEWVGPFTKATSYVVLWYFRHHSDEKKMVCERIVGTRQHLADDVITGVGCIPGADFIENGNVPFSDFEVTKYCAYESSRQARAYAKIAIFAMTGGA